MKKLTNKMEEMKAGANFKQDPDTSGIELDNSR